MQQEVWCVSQESQSQRILGRLPHFSASPPRNDFLIMHQARLEALMHTSFYPFHSPFTVQDM